jgi:hypothetical protein
VSPSRIVGTILLCGIGLWLAVTRHAKFQFGGDPDSTYRRSGVIHVNATGADAVAIGAFFIALGIINLAIGIRGHRRIPVFWTGAALFVATLLYGAVQAVRALI